MFINKSHKDSLLFVIIYYLFNSKSYPHKLYNKYGSEGDSNCRNVIDDRIKKYGFWKTLFNLYLNESNNKK